MITTSTPPQRPGGSLRDADLVWIPGGMFEMGSDRFYPEERPVRRVSVDGFWMARHTVTNQEFARFVAATGYITVAERPPDPALYPGAPLKNLAPGSLVFRKTSGPVDLRNYANWWTWTPGANWRQPRGPGSSIDGLDRYPVVQVAYEDAEAYCAWSGHTLPTEAEWERAARGGLEQAIFTWGDEEYPTGRPMANSWQGEFPWQNTAVDHYEHLSPVGSFPPNGYGLVDMAGNVWEWTADWYTVRHPDASDTPCCTPSNPRGATLEESFNPHQTGVRIPRKVVKGGSHLCAPNYCFRYRPAARQPQEVDTGMSHIGFRCIVRPSPTE